MPTSLAIGDYAGLTETAANTTGSNLDTGDLRRAFGIPQYNSFTELRVMSDPFLRALVTLKGRRVPVNSSDFKYTEKRNSFHKRYAYVTAHGTTSAVSTTADATVTATNIEAGDTYFFKMGTDYKSAGNKGSVYGQSTGAVAVGDAGTAPAFFVAGQVIRIPFGSAFNVPNDHIMAKITNVIDVATTHKILQVEVTRTLGTATNNELQWASATAAMTTNYSTSIANTASSLESKRTYVRGYAAAPGSGIPGTWADNPYSTAEGKCEIWKTALSIDGSTASDEFKFEKNERARLWRDKLIEHKWDIAGSLYFSSLRTDSDGARHTEGALEFGVGFGNIFTLDTNSKTQDDFLDDLSQLNDPRVGNVAQMMFYADKPTYNWMNKLSGYFSNNIQVTPNYTADFAFTGRNIPLANKTGINANTIATPYGDINVVHDVHLDGTGVKLQGIPMPHVRYRPKVGNGINRDTTIYPNVRTVQTTGEDKFVDLIMTEAALEPSMAEAWGTWL